MVLDFESQVVIKKKGEKYMQYYDVRYQTGTNEQDSVGVVAENSAQAVLTAEKELCALYGAKSVVETGCTLLEASPVELAYDREGAKYTIDVKRSN